MRPECFISSIVKMLCCNLDASLAEKTSPIDQWISRYPLCPISWFFHFPSQLDGESLSSSTILLPREWSHRHSWEFVFETSVGLWASVWTVWVRHQPIPVTVEKQWHWCQTSGFSTPGVSQCTMTVFSKSCINIAKLAAATQRWERIDAHGDDESCVTALTK